jgi:hypothetical protein
MTDLLDPPLLDPGHGSDDDAYVAPDLELQTIDEDDELRWSWPPQPDTWRLVEKVVTFAAVLGAVIFTLVQLHPGDIVANTTPAGGDMGAHVWGPAYLRDHILPHGRLSGWAPDWYGGFPMYQFYMVVPALMVVGLNVLLPYGISLKLISVLGIVTLPICAWAFARLARLPFPVPALFALGATFFLFDEQFSIYGGNIASTMAGEFSFSIALSLAVLFFGVLAYGLRTGKHRALAAGLFALSALCHGIVFFFVLAGGLLLWLLSVDPRSAATWLRRRGPGFASLSAARLGTLVLFAAVAGIDAITRAADIGIHLGAYPYLAVALICIGWHLLLDTRRTWFVAGVGVVGILLLCFWYLPFQLRHNYGTDMFYERRPVGNAPNGQPDSYWQMLFPNAQVTDWLLFLFSLAGFAGSIARSASAWRRTRTMDVAVDDAEVDPRAWGVGIAIGLLTIGYGVWAVLWPQNLLWNARLLPFFYLGRYLLVALGVAELGRAIARIIRPHDRDVRRLSLTSLTAVGLTGTIVLIGFWLGRLPGTREHVVKVKGQDTWVVDWGPFRELSTKKHYVSGWAKWNYSGYENKDAYGEYRGIVQAMKALGQDPAHGCGRAMWENNNDEDKYGTPMALMLLPFWTNGCIGSMEGLYFEAAGTTPFHFLTTSAMSKHSSDPVRRLKYEDGQVDKGVQYLQTLGVKYYLGYNDSVTAQADANPDLVPVASSGPWKVYEVKNTELVVPLTTEPVVVNGDLSASRDTWLELGTSWFQNQSAWPAMPVDTGPSSWQHIDLKRTSAERTDNTHLAVVAPAQPITPKALPAVQVSNVKTGDDFVSFSVDQPGVPVLVKVSYFPNWKVEGGKGPYRVAPNQMVVVPTGKNVRLVYGYTGLDLGSYALTGAGLIGLVVLWRLGPLALEPGSTGRRRRRRGWLLSGPLGGHSSSRRGDPDDRDTLADGDRARVAATVASSDVDTDPAPTGLLVAIPPAPDHGLVPPDPSASHPAPAELPLPTDAVRPPLPPPAAWSPPAPAVEPDLGPGEAWPPGSWSAVPPPPGTTAPPSATEGSAEP